MLALRARRALPPSFLRPSTILRSTFSTSSPLLRRSAEHHIDYDDDSLPEDGARIPLAIQANYFQPLRRKPTHGLPVCDLQIRSYSVRNLEFMCDFALRAAYYAGLPAFGPVPLPRKTERWTVPKGNFVHKKTQENFERVTMKRLIQIQDGHPETVELWLAFLKQHQYYGVGMKANVWGFEELGVGKRMNVSLETVRDVARPKWAHFGKGVDVATAEAARKILESPKYKELLGDIDLSPKTDPKGTIKEAEKVVGTEKIVEAAEAEGVVGAEEAVEAAAQPAEDGDAIESYFSQNVPDDAAPEADTAADLQQKADTLQSTVETEGEVGAENVVDANVKPAEEATVTEDESKLAAEGSHVESYLSQNAPQEAAPAAVEADTEEELQRKADTLQSTVEAAAAELEGEAAAMPGGKADLTDVDSVRTEERVAGAAGEVDAVVVEEAPMEDVKIESAASVEEVPKEEVQSESAASIEAASKEMAEELAEKQAAESEPVAEEEAPPIEEKTNTTDQAAAEETAEVSGVSGDTASEVEEIVEKQEEAEAEATEKKDRIDG